jgi:hypothetical protein
VAYLEYALSILANVEAPTGAKLEAVAMLNGMVAMLVRLEVSAGQTTQEWQARQVEFLGAVVAEGRHPHLAAAFGEPSAPDGDMLERVLPRVLAGLLGT